MRVITATLLAIAVLFCVFCGSAVTAESAQNKEDPGVGEARGVQSEIDNVHQQLVHKIQELEEYYARQRLPIYKKRNEVIRAGLRGFWARAIVNHPNVGTIAAQADYPILEGIIDIQIEDAVATSEDGTELDHNPQHHAGVYTVRLTFASPNKYFSDEVLWRVVDTYSPDQHRTHQASGIQWRPGMRPAEAAAGSSFFNFFERPQDYGSPDSQLDQQRLLTISHTLRYEIYANPFSFYDLPLYHAVAQEAQERLREQGASARDANSAAGGSSNYPAGMDPADVAAQEKAEREAAGNL